MNMPIAVWRVIEQMHTKFAGQLPATEDGARVFTRMCIEQLKFLFPAGGWCWKSSTPNHPPSKDVIARQIDGRFEGWDCLIAAGETGPRQLSGYPPSFHDLIAEGNQNPIPVDARNHLGATKPDDEEEPGGGGGEEKPGGGGGEEGDDPIVDVLMVIASSLETIGAALVKVCDQIDQLQRDGVRLNIGR